MYVDYRLLYGLLSHHLNAIMMVVIDDTSQKDRNCQSYKRFLCRWGEMPGAFVDVKVDCRVEKEAFLRDRGEQNLSDF